MRSGHKKAALLTLVGDALKGWLAVFVAQRLGFSDNVVGLVALAVFIGPLFPVFLKFRGGKGVATAAGVLFALDPLLGLAVAATWLFVAFAFRYSSLAAVLAAALAPVYQVLLHGGNGRALVVGILALALIGKHWQNLQRLLAGQEAKIEQEEKLSAPRRWPERRHSLRRSAPCRFSIGQSTGAWLDSLHHVAPDLPSFHQGGLV